MVQITNLSSSPGRLYVLIMSHTCFRVYIFTLCLPECQGTPCLTQAWNLKFKWLQWNSNPQTGLNGWLFLYKLSGCGFESCCSHLNFRFCVCFEQGVHWHSGKYRVWIHSETHTWHDKNIQSHVSYRYVLTA